MQIPLLLVSSERFADHLTPPGHPERVERAEVFEGVALRWRDRGGRIAEPRPATEGEVARVHDAGYSGRSRPPAAGPCGWTPIPTPRRTRTTSRCSRPGRRSWASTTPSITERQRSCWRGRQATTQNAIAPWGSASSTTSRSRRRTPGRVAWQRVAVVDFDVHHGNGTQWMFYEDPSVFYVSTHQFPYYPGTGGAAEIGRDRGAGFTMNVPLEAGATDADYDLVFAELIVPVLEAFRPELLLLSAGFDAHHRDPLASMRVSTDGFAAIVTRMWHLAARSCQGRLVAVTEGGYDLVALAGGLDATIEVLSVPPPEALEAMQGDHARGREVSDLVRSVLGPYWPGL